MGSDYRKWLKGILSTVTSAGWRVRDDGPHIVVYPADTAKSPITLARTSSAPREIANRTADLRRSGLDI